MFPFLSGIPHHHTRPRWQGWVILFLLRWSTESFLIIIGIIIDRETIGRGIENQRNGKINANVQPEEWTPRIKRSQPRGYILLDNCFGPLSNPLLLLSQEVASSPSSDCSCFSRIAINIWFTNETAFVWSSKVQMIVALQTTTQRRRSQSKEKRTLTSENQYNVVLGFMTSRKADFIDMFPRFEILFRSKNGHIQLQSHPHK